MKVCKATNGTKFVVDDDDYEVVRQYSWDWLKPGYIVRSSNGQIVRLHRMVMKAPKGMDVDHVDGNRLNNCKQNLRICTRQQNTFNAGPLTGKTSIYKGVHWDKKNQKWRAQIKIGSKQKHLGLFIDESAAALKYNEAAAVLCGEYARLNKVH